MNEFSMNCSRILTLPGIHNNDKSSVTNVLQISIFSALFPYPKTLIPNTCSSKENLDFIRNATVYKMPIVPKIGKSAEAKPIDTVRIDIVVRRKRAHYSHIGLATK